MGYDYDKLYGETPNALGAPTQAFTQFFATYPRRVARVLDIGCGQGRDALFIARQGHHVTGVDLSPNGIRDLTRTAQRERLNVHGIVADITDFAPDGLFDILLIDRTLHMLNAPDRAAVFKRLLDCVAPEGWVLIADERSNMPVFKAAMADGWHLSLDTPAMIFAQRI